MGTTKEVKQFDEELDQMIAFYKGDYLFETKDRVESFIQAYEEKAEVLVCFDCMKAGKFYFDGEGKVACRHHWEGLLEQFRNL